MGRQAMPSRTEDIRHCKQGLSSATDKPTTKTHHSSTFHLQLTHRPTRVPPVAEVTTGFSHVFMVKNGHFKTRYPTRFRVPF